MRAAFIVSAVLHFALLAAAIITLPAAKSFSTPPVEALPVELVTIADETDLTIGRADAEEVVETPAEKTVEADTPPDPAEQPGATDKPAEKVATDEKAIDSRAESAAPEPTGEPDPVEEPQRTEEPQETEVAALPEPQEEPKPEPQPQPEQATTPAPVPETVVPSKKPRPPKKRTQTARVERKQEENFDADRLSQLINRTAPSGGGSGSSQASLGSENGRAAAALTMSEMDALRAQMQRCWNPPIGLANGGEIIVSVTIRLAPDGSVVSIDDMQVPGVGQIYDASADAARRAVLMCQPYSLPASKYETWKEVKVNFDPRSLF